MLDADRLLDSKLAHVVAVVLGVVGVVGLVVGAPTVWFWILYGIAWLAFLDLFDGDDAGRFWEGVFTGSTDESESVGDRAGSDRATRHAEDDGEDPLAVLKRRYAEGAIDDDEFEERLDRLLETPDTLAELERARG
ncbi:SHOCT domain-containing protein [Halobaculum litoreum]|uniref:SHOCT domain-containing protein n=1 Tax=Halobaculum litoreum TaxID=3031998 RepID=A0ABD5XT54_9EURY|nr:SHOCT domain-containing protein [Halobaculum sp. DT92]